MERYGNMRNSEGYFDPTAGTVLHTVERGTKMSIKRGDIYWVEIRSATGHEMDKDRPGIVVSCDELNETSPLVSVVYLSTSTSRLELPEHVTIRSAERPSTALCEQVYSVDKVRLNRLCGRVTVDELRLVDMALMIGLALSPVALQATQSDEKKKSAETDSVLLKAKDALRVEAELDMYKRLYESLLDRLTGRAG
ncbi:MAG: type II toxin-antitoxin system PemK/MazF family toxin [Bacteroides sp.]